MIARCLTNNRLAGIVNQSSPLPLPRKLHPIDGADIWPDPDCFACLTGSRLEFPVGSSRPLPWLLIVPFLGRDAFRRRTLLGARKEIWARAAPPPRHSAELFTFPLNKIGRSGSRRPGTGWERLTSVCDPVWATSVPCGAAETIITEFPVVLSTYPTASDPRPPKRNTVPPSSATGKPIQAHLDGPDLAARRAPLPGMSTPRLQRLAAWLEESS